MSTQLLSLAHVAKSGPAFTSTRPALTQVKPAETIQKPAHICGVATPALDFNLGARVALARDLYVLGTVVGITFHSDSDQPRWQYSVRWDNEELVSETPCAPVDGYGYFRFDGTRKRANYYDCDGIVLAGEVYVCSTCGERHINDTGVCDRCEDLQ